MNSVVLKGSSGTASGDYSVAEGYKTSATSYDSHAEGGLTLASGGYSHAEGYSTSATSQYSHAEGNSTKASGNYGSHAEGYDTKANGDSSHAEGYDTKANGNSSHAEGNETSAMTSYSHAEGGWTTASGSCSHAEGQNTIASGSCSHAEGAYSTASGQYSHTEGYYSIANNKSEHASGQYNISNSATIVFGNSGNTLFSVGNGTADNARHNAFEIRQNGDIYIVNKDGNDVKLQDEIGNITIDQTIDSGTSASTNAVSTKAVYDFVTNDFYTKDEIDDAEYVMSMAINDLNTNKLDASAYTPTDLSNYYTKSETSGATEISNALGGKVNSATFTAHTADTTIHLTSGDVQTQIDNSISGKVNTSDIVTAITPSNSGSTDPIATKVVAENELTVSNALTDLDERKLDATAYTSTIEASGVTAMTGYQIAASSASVLTTDTLLETIGKLEKRIALLESAIGGMTFVKLTSQQYADLSVKDPNTLYIIND